MIKAIYPGSFDPVTYGHLDVIKRASKVVDELIIGVLVNQEKTPLFTREERVELLKQTTKEFPNVRVLTFTGRILNPRCRLHRLITALSRRLIRCFLLRVLSMLS